MTDIGASLASLGQELNSKPGEVYEVNIPYDQQPDIEVSHPLLVGNGRLADEIVKMLNLHRDRHRQVELLVGQ